MTLTLERKTDTTEIVSNAKIKTWRRCPKQYEYRYIYGLRPKERAIQLERGSWIHELLMVHYDGGDWREKHEELEKQFNAVFDEEREELIEDFGDLPRECKRIMTAYLRHYEDVDKHYEVVDSEVDEVIELPNGQQFNFIIDLIMRDKRDGSMELWDHKTGEKFLDHDWMVLDAQLTRYFWAAQRLGYTPLIGAKFNELRTKVPTVPKLTAKTKQLERKKNMDTDAVTYLREIKRHGLDPQDYRAMLVHLREQDKSGKWFRRTLLPKDTPTMKQMMRELVWSVNEIKRAERTDQFPRTPDKSCKWGCSYMGPCAIELQGGDPSHEFKLRYETKDKRKEKKR